MVRIVKAPAVRRTEILDAAQRLVTVKGYEQMAIQDILDELQISKGAFYHYFGSKQMLLAALIERLQAGMAQPLYSLVQDGTLPAPDKLQRCFALLFRAKTAQKEFFLPLLRAWYTDENALVRQTVQAHTFEQFAPPLEELIEQGIREGALALSSAAGMGRMTLSLAQDLSDVLAEWLLADEPQRATKPPLAQIVALYSRAIERVLQAPSDSLHIVDLHQLDAWLAVPREKVSGGASAKDREA